MNIKASISLTETDKEVSTINFQVRAENTFKFKSTEEEYAPKHLVVQEAVDKAASRLTKDILNLIDRDQDPYQIEL